MALIKILNKGESIHFLIPAGYLPMNDEVIEVILSEDTRNANVLKITAPRAIIITHQKGGAPGMIRENTGQ
jgi:hypothetical protein